MMTEPIEFEEFDYSQLSPRFDVDDIRKIRDFHDDMYAKYGEPYLRHWDKQIVKNATKVEADIERLRAERSAAKIDVSG